METGLKFLVNGKNLTGIKDSGIDKMILTEVMEMAKNKLAPLMQEIKDEEGTVSFDVYTRNVHTDHCSETLNNKINRTFAT